MNQYILEQTRLHLARTDKHTPDEQSGLQNDPAQAALPAARLQTALLVLEHLLYRYRLSQARKKAHLTQPET